MVFNFFEILLILNSVKVMWVGKGFREDLVFFFYLMGGEIKVREGLWFS